MTDLAEMPPVEMGKRLSDDLFNGIAPLIEAAAWRRAAAHLEARAAGEDALGEYATAVALRVGRDALMVRAAEIEGGSTT